MTGAFQSPVFYKIRVGGIASTPQYQSLIHKSAKEAGTNASDRSLRGRTGGQG